MSLRHRHQQRVVQRIQIAFAFVDGFYQHMRACGQGLLADQRNHLLPSDYICQQALAEPVRPTTTKRQVRHGDR